VNYTKDRPMPAQKYRDDMSLLGAGWTLCAILVGLTVLLVLVHSLMTGEVRTSEVIILVSVLLVCAPISLLIRHRARQTDRQWHLFRGDVDEVDVRDLESSGVRVWFVDDGSYTTFSKDDYLAHSDALQPDKRFVLIVRRSTALGAPTYEGTFR